MGRRTIKTTLVGFLLTFSLWARHKGSKSVRSIAALSINSTFVPELESSPAVRKADKVAANDGGEAKRMKGRKRMRGTPNNEFTNAEVEDLPESNTGRTIPNCLDPDGPQPIILMTLGRSGSGSTWQVIGSLTGKVTPSKEYTGSGTPQSIKFFDKIGSDDGGWWLMKYMCAMQRKFRNAGVFGFKWKPWPESIHSPASINGLKLLSELKNPSIKVIRSKRNPLDVILSRMKHNRHRRIPAHCEVGEEDCVKAHLKAGSINLPTKDLLDLLRNITKGENETDELLDTLRVPHVHVSFEKLYFGDDAEEWSRIFRFLGVGPSEGLTMERVNEVMEHASTSHQGHKNAIRNFEDVRKILSGTEFEELLHP